MQRVLETSLFHNHHHKHKSEIRVLAFSRQLLIHHPSEYSSLSSSHPSPSSQRNRYHNPIRMSSGYENVVVGKLRLKGKALDVKSSSGIKKKKKKHMSRHYHHELLHHENNFSSDSITENLNKDNGADEEKLTPAERRYMQRWKQIEMQRLAKFASKSHRQRIEEFNQYLANLTEHYDIPKVGPG